MHVETEKKDDSLEVNFSNNRGYYIPKTKEIMEEENTKKLNNNLSLLPSNINSSIKHLYNQYNQNPTLYGEYFPQTYSKKSEDMNGVEITPGYSVDPIKYITNLLVRRYLEHSNKVQEIVMHPDLIYFGSKGRKENISKVIDYLNNLGKILEQKIFFENLTFSNEKYKKSLGLFEDPYEIFNIVKNYENIGVTIDIQHLEKSNKIVSLDLIRSIPHNRLIIHSREGYGDKYRDIYYYAVKNGIPWIIE